MGDELGQISEGPAGHAGMLEDILGEKGNAGKF